MNNKFQKIKPPNKVESIIIKTMIIIGVLSTLNFLYFFFSPKFRGFLPLYVILSLVLIYGALKKFYLWYHYFDISVPPTPIPSKDYKVDILTTYFPGEPYEMILRTLEAIQNITYPHSAYLCDEANDEYLKRECERLGVIHVTRNNRINAKAGNINNALAKATGEICLVLDPDHVPTPNFLDVVLPYFKDEQIGFVQVVQAYYNKPHTLVARGASEQTFQFYGPMMMTMNSYGTVNAIGANCTFRRSALDSIGGHAPGLAEDMHTAMLMHAEGWKSVYVPELVAKGLAPSDLTSYFKQQLKWSRGTFELLYSVYPKLFKKFTLRQKIHYALLPLHYLIGFIYLISFLIPIISLIFSKMPWTGDMLYFIIISLPVLMSSVLIRIYIQKWVIEKNDRGFHVIGGLLQLISWWIFILGVVYTFIRKKVPFLPTPKSEEETNMKIVIPNLIIGLSSIFAIIYGLNQDFTPFSLIMAFFALLNAVFMFFSIYLAAKVTNRNQILRTALEGKTVQKLKELKGKFIKMADYVFTFARHLALPLLLFSVLVSTLSFDFFEKGKWNVMTSENTNNKNVNYLGIFNPSSTNGITDLDQVRQKEQQENIDFQIISFYLAWGDSVNNELSAEYLSKIRNMGASPLITWEPWVSSFHKNDSIRFHSKDKGVFEMISSGYFDAYIRKTAIDIKNLDHPVFLRFAHEFDNPAYPWAITTTNNQEDFIKAWRHVHDIFRNFDVRNVRWIWNPWKPDNIQEMYPGDRYVDWLGVTLLNYGSLNSDGVWYPFDSLYMPYHELFKKVSKRPVMLAEFGSLSLGGDKKKWMSKAFEAIESKYPEIKAVVLFNSKYDRNIPENDSLYNKEYLDWSAPDLGLKDDAFFKPKKDSIKIEVASVSSKVNHVYSKLAIDSTWRGVNYRKSNNWLHNNYIASRDVLAQDFEMMKQIGIKAIKYQHSPIYDNNVLKYSEQYGIKMIYSFSIPDKIDFIRDKNELIKLKCAILDKVERQKNAYNIVGWNIAEDAWSNFSYTLIDLSSLEQQREAYTKWLKDLVLEIKKIDDIRPLTVDIDLTYFTKSQIRLIQKEGLKIDGFGIIIKESHYLDEFLSFAQNEKIPFLISSVVADQLNVLQNKLGGKSFFLANWQNQWETGNITLDGLLDFNGKKKQDYALVADYLKKDKIGAELPMFKILRPAKQLSTDKEVLYQALVYDNGSWVNPTGNESYSFEWRLAYTDDYGEIVAMKKLSNAPNFILQVPENYRNYRIILTMEKGEFSKTIVKSLNTPLYKMD